MYASLILFRQSTLPLSCNAGSSFLKLSIVWLYPKQKVKKKMGIIISLGNGIKISLDVFLSVGLVLINNNSDPANNRFLPLQGMFYFFLPSAYYPLVISLPFDLGATPQGQFHNLADYIVAQIR